MVAANHMGQLHTWNMVSIIVDLNFTLYLILINLSLSLNSLT